MLSSGISTNSTTQGASRQHPPALKIKSSPNQPGTEVPLKKRSVGNPKSSSTDLTTTDTFDNNNDNLADKPAADIPDTAASRPAKKEPRKKTSPVPAPVEQAEAEEKFGWVDIHAGFNRTSPVLSGNSGQPGYFSKRKSEESGALRPSYGISFFYKVKRIVGSFGADITTYGESVDYSDQAVKRYQRVVGGQFVSYDSTITNPAFMAQRQNRLIYVEFPVYIGYEFPTRGKFGATVMGGLSMGFLITPKITYIDTALTGAYVYENSKNETFRQQVFSVGLLPSFEYRMRSASALYLSFPLRYQLSSVLHHDSDVKQKYFSPGVQLGYRIFIKSQ